MVPYLLNSKEFLTFLRCDLDLEQVFSNKIYFIHYSQKALKPFESDSIENIVVKYQKVFEELSGVC